jgi:hypothetical protein
VPSAKDWRQSWNWNGPVSRAASTTVSKAVRVLPSGQRRPSHQQGKRQEAHDLLAEVYAWRALTLSISRRLNAEVRDEVEAIVAVRSVAKRLGINTGTAILSIRRVYVTAGDEPVNLTLLLTRTDRYKTSVRLRESAFD